MGLFDWFRKEPPPEEAVERIAIGVADFLVPDLVFNDYAEYVRIVATNGASVGTYFYIAMAKLLRLPFDEATGRKFLWKVGELEGGLQYHAIEYPKPMPLVDERDVCVSVRPAPYFSALVGRPGSSEIRYFILDQAFGKDRTTLHEKTAGGKIPGGTSYVLGPGPAPTFDGFLEAVRAIADPQGSTPAAPGSN